MMYQMRSAILLTLALAMVFATPAYVLERQRGTIPSQRGASTFSSIGNKLVLYGGFDECFDLSACEHTFYDETWIFKTTNNKWTRSTATTLPPARAFHPAASYDATDSAVIYGGVIYNAAFTAFQVYGDFWQYFIDDDVWVERTAFNAGPGPRVGASLAIKGHEMFFFGGLDNFFVSHNDFWKYNFISNLWTQLYADVPDGTSGRPDSRYLAKFERSGDTIYLYAGNVNPSQLGVQRADFWEYSISGNSLTEVAVPSSIRSRVHGAAAATHKGFVSALGDVNDDINECKANEISGGQNAVNETHVFKRTDGWHPFVTVADPPKWKKVPMLPSTTRSGYGVDSTSFAPRPRSTIPSPPSHSGTSTCTPWISRISASKNWEEREDVLKNPLFLSFRGVTCLEKKPSVYHHCNSFN